MYFFINVLSFYHVFYLLPGGERGNVEGDAESARASERE